MMQRISAMAMGLMAICLLAAAPQTAQAQMEENPLYAAWAKFKPGASATLKHTMHMEGGGMNMDRTFESTSKLLEVTPEKVTVEASTSAGARNTTHKQEIAAQVGANDQKKPHEMGQESITVDGKTYNCKIYRLQLNQQGAVVDAKAWLAPDVPGGVVKMESHVTQGDMKVTDQAMLSHFEAKK